MSLFDDAPRVEVAAVPRPKRVVAHRAEAAADYLVRRSPGLLVRARAAQPRMRARGLENTGFARDPVLFFDLPFFSIGGEGGCSLFPFAFLWTLRSRRTDLLIT